MNFKEFGFKPCWDARLGQSQYVFPLFSAGTYVTQVTATDADDPTYGNSARVVYSILHGQPYFSVDPKTGNVLIFEESENNLVFFLSLFFFLYKAVVQKNKVDWDKCLLINEYIGGIN